MHQRIDQVPSTIGLWLSFVILPVSASPAFGNTAVHFDVPPVVAAVDVGHGSAVQVQLRVSTMISAIEERPLDQWMLRVTPRQPSLFVNDYAPRTEAVSHLAGPVEIKITSEDARSFGITGVGAYGPIHTDAGLDAGNKTIHSKTFQELPPMQAITASGTIRQGRGVFFKLRAEGQQVLEGEKRFTISFDVPADWQGGLLDAEIVAHKKSRSLGSFDEELRTVARQHFVVAAYRSENTAARRWALSVFDAEQELRRAASNVKRSSLNSLPEMIHSVAARIDGWSSGGQGGVTHRSVRGDWLDRLLMDRCDPYTDREMKKLPVDVRAIALNYCKKRDRIKRLTETPVHVGMGKPEKAKE